MKKIITIISATILTCSCCQSKFESRERLDLSGSWQTQLGDVTLPGTTDEAQLGDTITDRTLTLRLQRKHSYVGQLTYSRSIDIPQSMANKHLRLVMERTKATTLFVDGDSISSLHNLQTRQIYDINGLTAGTHKFDIRVDNSTASILPDLYGSHALTEHTQTNWNGILGQFYIEALPGTYINNIFTYPNVENNSADIVVDIVSDTTCQANVCCNVTLDIVHNTTSSKSISKPDSILTLTKGLNHVKLTIPLSDKCAPWSEFYTAVNKLDVKIEANGTTDCQSTTFGLSKFTARNKHFYINDKKTFLRGKHDGCVFPITGYAPMTVDEWIKTFNIAKSYGINHYRFHSWCPPEAAFVAADITGIYLQPELPYWGTLSRKNVELNEWLINEGQHMLEEYGNHPSFVMMALGNELRGDISLMREMVDTFRLQDNRHLYAFGSNNFLGYRGPQEGEDFFVACRIGGERDKEYNTHVRASFSFADTYDGGILNGTYPNTRMTFDEALKASDIPVISHETCQYQIFPNFDETQKYTGVLEAVNYDVFREHFKQTYGDGYETWAKAFQTYTGKLSMACYKADIEMCLRSQDMAGFQLLDLQDYPGQGSALVGPLDAFMDSKGLITPDEFMGFCAPTTPLALMDKYTWTTDEHFTADVALTNYSAEDINGHVLTWSLFDNNNQQSIKSDSIIASIQQGEVLKIGNIDVDLSDIKAPTRLTLTIVFNNNIKNSYDIYVYDDNDKSHETLKYATTLDPDTKKQLDAGHNVLFVPQHSNVTDVTVGPLFTPDYWNYSMFKGISEKNDQPVSPGTLAYWFDEKSDTFTAFPNNGHSDWQWWIVAKNTRPLIIDNVDNIKCDIMAIDNVDRAHKLGVLMTIPVSKGNLIVCMTDLNKISNTPEGRQFIRSIKLYTEKSNANNGESLTWQQIVELFSKSVNERQLVGFNNITDYKKE